MTTLNHVREAVGSDKDLRSLYDKRITEAGKQTQEHVAHKITTPSKGLSRIVDQPPLLYHDDKQLVNERTVPAFLKQYRETLSEDRRALFDRFKPVDAAMKVVGVGSVGARCYVVLLLATPNDPLFLQVEEARPSVFEPYTRRTPVEQNGHRVVTGQRLMQSSSDIFLGWAKGPQRVCGNAAVNPCHPSITRSRFRRSGCRSHPVSARASDTTNACSKLADGPGGGEATGRRAVGGRTGEPERCELRRHHDPPAAFRITARR